MPKRPVSEQRQTARRSHRQKPVYRVKHAPVVAQRPTDIPPVQEAEVEINLYQEDPRKSQTISESRYGLRVERVSEVIELRSGSSRSPSPSLDVTGSIEIEGYYSSDESDKEVQAVLAELSGLFPDYVAGRFRSVPALEIPELEPHAVIEITPSPSPRDMKPNGNLLASKAAVVAQLKEQTIVISDRDSMDETIEYKAKVEKLGSDLRKAQSESKHYQQLARKLKADLGALLKRSFHMLREARDKAASYKQQLDEVQKERMGDANGRNRHSSLSSQGSNDLEILSMNSNNSASRVYTPPPILPPAAMTFADMPGAPWWSQPPTGVHHLFDEFDEKVEKGSDAERALRHQQHRRTIGPSEIQIGGQDPMRSNVPFDAFDKYLFV